MLYIIYKQFFDENGNVESAEIVECETNEKLAISYTKLYGLQTPMDLKSKYAYGYTIARIN